MWYEHNVPLQLHTGLLERLKIKFIQQITYNIITKKQITHNLQNQNLTSPSKAYQTQHNGMILKSATDLILFLLFNVVQEA